MERKKKRIEWYVGLLAPSEAEYSSFEAINVLFFIILVDQGAVTGGGKKSKRARENSGEKKSRMQRRGSSLHFVLDSFSPEFFLARLDFFPPSLTAPGSPRMVFISEGKLFLTPWGLWCLLSLLSTSLLEVSTTFRRFSPKMLWECKYWGNRIQFSRASTTFEMNWTYSSVPRNMSAVQATDCNKSHTPLSLWHSRSIILIFVVLRDWKTSNICQFRIFFNIFRFLCAKLCSSKHNSNASPALELSTTHFFPALASLLRTSPKCGREFETGLLDNIANGNGEARLISLASYACSIGLWCALIYA